MWGNTLTPDHSWNVCPSAEMPHSLCINQHRTIPPKKFDTLIDYQVVSYKLQPITLDLCFIRS
jgi:hypothetical protein